MSDRSCRVIYNQKFETKDYSILVVEDSKSVNKILTTTFQREGFSCHSAFSLSQAYEVLEKEDIHYIMLDINLPDGNGYELIDKLEKHSQKIFVLTDETDEHLRNMAYQKGIIDFIVKDKNFFHKIHQIKYTIEQFEKNKAKTILVVDDSIVIQKQLEDLLTNRYYDVKLASDTNEALEIIESYPIDLILLDIQLKDSNGLEFLTQNKHEIINIKKIPVLIISGHIDNATMRDGIKAGAKDILRKPYIPEELVLKVDLWIDYKRKEEEVLCSRKLLEEYKDAVDESTLVSKTDQNGIITYVNEHFVKLSGFDKSELLGKNHNIVRHPDTPKELFENMWETIKKKKKAWKGKVKNLTKDGKDYWVDAMIKPIIDNKGNIVEFIGIRNDVTALELAKKEIEFIHKQTKSSIEYASLIQHSLIPNQELFKNYFKEHLAIWEPKDIVGGDIYLVEPLNDDECIVMVIDCTGHGVPGAFVTMLVKAIERQVVSIINNNSFIEVSPAWILSYFNKTMKTLLKQDHKDAISNAGFDGAVLYYNKKENNIKYASTNTPLFYFDENSELNILKGDRHSIGYKKSDIDYEFKEYSLDTKEGMSFYISSDGYLDQNGGEKEFPFGKKRFKQLLEDNQNNSFEEQKTVLLDSLSSYQGTCERNDDITVVGLKL